MLASECRPPPISVTSHTQQQPSRLSVARHTHGRRGGEQALPGLVDHLLGDKLRLSRAHGPLLQERDAAASQSHEKQLKNGKTLHSANNGMKLLLGR